MKPLELVCDRVSSDVLTVDLSNPAEAYLTMSFSREQPEVLLTDRSKVQELRDALSVWLGDEPMAAQDLRRWFGLSYASWLTLPRVLLQAMPEDWQGRMAGLLREYDAAYPNQPGLGTTVRCTSSSGRLVETPGWITNYRHPNAAEIDKCRGEK